MPVDDLKKSLKGFYVNVSARKNQGIFSIKCTTEHLLRVKTFASREKNIDIVKDYEFNESNKIYRAVSIDL